MPRAKKKKIKDEVKSDDKKNSKAKYSINKQLLIILIGMATLVIIFFIASAFFQRLNKFEYNGLTFTKEKFGQIPVYHYYYFLKGKQGQLIKYNLYLRIDPRKNNVSINGEIVLRDDKSVYLSVNSTGLTQCEYGAAGIASLSQFLSGNQLIVRGASPDEKEAYDNNVWHATCEKWPSDTVILIEKGDSTKIIRDNENCYRIEVTNCEILDAIEKFQTQSIIDARERLGLNSTITA